MTCKLVFPGENENIQTCNVNLGDPSFLLGSGGQTTAAHHDPPANCCQQAESDNCQDHLFVCISPNFKQRLRWMLTLLLCCDKDEWQTHAVPVNWLSTKLSMSKTKVALRKYSLFILKLYPVLKPLLQIHAPLLRQLSKQKNESSFTHKWGRDCFEGFDFVCVIELGLCVWHIVLYSSVSQLSMKSVFLKSGVMTKW